MSRSVIQSLAPLVVAFWCQLATMAHAQEGIGTKTLPSDFSALIQKPAYLASGSGRESTFTRLLVANIEIIQRLSEYNSASVAEVFSGRMEKEPDVHMRLLLAALAAKSGAEAGKKFIVATADNTNYEVTLSRLSALHFLATGNAPKEWVFDAVHLALADTRKVTGLEKTKWQSGTSFEVSYLADEMEHLTYALGRAKNPKSVPVLVEMARRTHGSRGPITALGMIGDARAIPICLEFLQKEVELIKNEPASHSAPSEELTRALAGLKAKEAIPTLLSYLHSKEVIAALGAIDDERAIEPLRRIIAAGGKVEPDPYTWASRFQERSFSARMALIKLEGGDPIPKWIEVLNDHSLEWLQRREAVWELGWHPDPRAIAPLLSLVKSDSNGAIVNQSITVLSAFKYKAAVPGLIECFDVNYAGKSDWKRAYTPDMFFKNIAETLRTLTGKDFGPDKAQWQKWWNAEGIKMESLK